MKRQQRLSALVPGATWPRAHAITEEPFLSVDVDGPTGSSRGIACARPHRPMSWVDQRDEDGAVSSRALTPHELDASTSAYEASLAEWVTLERAVAMSVPDGGPVCTFVTASGAYQLGEWIDGEWRWAAGGWLSPGSGPE